MLLILNIVNILVRYNTALCFGIHIVEIEKLPYYFIIENHGLIYKNSISIFQDKIKDD